MSRVLISMPDEFLDKIDNIAKKENRTRSELIREALRSYTYKAAIKDRDLNSDSRNASLLESIL